MWKFRVWHFNGHTLFFEPRTVTFPCILFPYSTLRHKARYISPSSVASASSWILPLSSFPFQPFLSIFFCHWAPLHLFFSAVDAFRSGICSSKVSRHKEEDQANPFLHLSRTSPFHFLRSSNSFFSIFSLVHHSVV